MFENAKVIVLKREDLEIVEGKVKIINKQLVNKDGCLMLYAHWCGHCQNKEELMNKLGAKYNNEKWKYYIAVINGAGDEMSDIKSALKLEGFPTFYSIVCTSNGTYIREMESDAKKLLNMLFEEN